MAATRLIPLHINKGKPLAQCLKERIGYAENSEKTEEGRLVTGYECDPQTCAEEFQLMRREYRMATGRDYKGDVIAYQIRQSFKPGEITPEEANRVGYETALRFTKGQHAFIVATHTDRAHIHNHVIFSSTTLDCMRKFRNTYWSSVGLQRVSDAVCLEHGLSVIEKGTFPENDKPEQKQRTRYPKTSNFRKTIRRDIDICLIRRPESFEKFIFMMEELGYEAKRGKNTAFRGRGQQRFLRMSSLGDGYSEEDVRNVIAGKSDRPLGRRIDTRKDGFSLLIDIEKRMAAKENAGFIRWATAYNLKQMSEIMLFLRAHNIDSFDELFSSAKEKADRFNALSDTIRAEEQRMREIMMLKTHILNYRKTKDTYAAFRQSGYSQDFLETHREEITLHKAAKEAFDALETDRIPSIYELNEEYAEVSARKNVVYKEYRKAKEEMQRYLTAERNVKDFYEMTEEIGAPEKTQTR